MAFLRDRIIRCVRSHLGTCLSANRASIFSLLSALAFTTISSLAQGTIVVPSAYANKEGEAYSVDAPFNQGTPARYQALYPASQFVPPLANGGWIYGIGFRVDERETEDTQVQVQNLEIHASTSPRTGQMSDTWADNIGPDETTVVPNGLTLILKSTHGHSPNPFDLQILFKNRFFYDPNNGDLLIDMMVHSPFYLLAGVDVGFATDVRSRAGSLSLPQSLGGGASYITEFLVEPVPEPSPSLIFGMAGAGLILCVFWKKRCFYVGRTRH
jgi:hypothetical protein